MRERCRRSNWGERKEGRREGGREEGRKGGREGGMEGATYMSRTG